MRIQRTLTDSSEEKSGSVALQQAQEWKCLVELLRHTASVTSLSIVNVGLTPVQVLLPSSPKLKIR